MEARPKAALRAAGREGAGEAGKGRGRGREGTGDRRGAEGDRQKATKDERLKNSN